MKEFFFRLGAVGSVSILLVFLNYQMLGGNVIIVWCVGGAVLSLAFPPTFLFKKPLYFEDLQVSAEGNQLNFAFETDGFQEQDSIRLQVYFKRLLSVSSALLFSTIVYYYTYDFLHNSRLSFLESVGIIGGLANMYQTLIQLIGKGVLAFLIRCKS